MVNVMATKEIIFKAIPAAIPGSAIFGKELHFTLNEDNHVEWQVIPEGERGRSRPFEDLQAAEGFANGYAARLGFIRRLENINSKGGE